MVSLNLTLPNRGRQLIDFLHKNDFYLYLRNSISEMKLFLLLLHENINKENSGKMSVRFGALGLKSS